MALATDALQVSLLHPAVRLRGVFRQLFLQCGLCCSVLPPLLFCTPPFVVLYSPLYFFVTPSSVVVYSLLLLYAPTPPVDE
jgi:hypothetical protein